MKVEKYFLILAAIIGILCATALGEIEPSQADEVEPILIDSIVYGSTLSGIEELSAVVIFVDDNVANKKELLGKELRKETEQSFAEKGLVRKTFEEKVKRKLEKSSIRLSKPSYETPNFAVVVHIIRPSDSQQYVFCAYSSLIRLVHYQHKGVNLRFSTEVWQSDLSLQVTSIEDLPDKITQVVMQQIDTFAAEYHSANLPNEQASGKNDISITPKEKPKPAAEPIAKPTPAESECLASKNSKVFHKPDCSWIRTIKPENLVRYSSRDEAISSGKRPCKRCNP